MFATAGTLNAEKEGENFSDHRENILKTAKVNMRFYVVLLYLVVPLLGAWFNYG